MCEDMTRNVFDVPLPSCVLLAMTKIIMSNQSKSNKPCVQPRWLFASIELNISFQELDIQNMDLERNELGAFCGIWEIVTLNLENNKLTTLPELCSSKCCLVNLYVGKNNISQLSKHFLKNFQKLQRVNLSNNNLFVLPVMHWMQHSVSFLVANKNKIQSLDALKTDGVYRKLKYISVYHNDIHLFNVSLLHRMPKLESFYLNANKLTQIYDVRSLHKIGMNLMSNPWHCGEALSWMGEEDLEFERGLTCATPACLHGMAIADMSKSMQCSVNIMRLNFF